MGTPTYLLSASGKDRVGFVALIAEKLFHLGCNLEDSYMMRLETEFALFVIFSSKKEVSEKDFFSLVKKHRMAIYLKKISHRNMTTGHKNQIFIIRAHGPDRPGIVYHLSNFLAKNKMNIVDLATHQIKSGGKYGYSVFIEVEIPNRAILKNLPSQIKKLSLRTNTRITLDPLTQANL